MLVRQIDFDETDKLRDAEVAIMDAFKTVFEILLTAGVKPAQIDKLLASQMQAYSRPPMARAIWVMEQLRAFVQNAERATARQQVRQILTEPPAGSA
jgi:hypothetical protein